MISIPKITKGNNSAKNTISILTIYKFTKWHKTEKNVEGRDFFCVPQGPIMGPCPNTNYPIFSQLDKKKQLENKSKKFSLIIIKFSFLLMFFISLYDYM